MTMIDNDDVFLNLSSYPNPTAAFNSIMRQYYDTEGNLIRRRRQTNENREILSSVQSTNTRTRTKKDALTLDLLLTKSPYRIISKEEMTRTREVAGKEILTSTTPPTDSNKNFDMRDFVKHYSPEQQTRDRNNDNNINKNKLTLADLQSARQRTRRPFLIKNNREEDDY
jgi:YD repeat-containing protein